MTLVAHLSDLHFGRTDPRVVDALVTDLHHHRPDLVIISGDLTQRARSRQFAEAREFLDRLPAPALVVPGNHDLAPLFRPLTRLFQPRALFHRALPNHEPWPVWTSPHLVAIGLDSTRHMRWVSGKLRESHLDHIDAVLAEAPDGLCRLAFLHHPPATALSGHPFEALAEHGIDVVLTGHVHRAHVEVIHGGNASSCILVQASTACSTRLRDDANGYCLIKAELPQLEVTIQGWTGDSFHPRYHHRFHKDGEVWRMARG
jgi:3',5'-cyclic AMP phosphodiesterase CpdA